MSLKRYDEALLYKLKSVFENSVAADQDTALYKSSDDKAIVKLPLISFYRTNNPVNTEMFGNDSLNRRGRFVIPLESSVKVLPINIFYQIDIWSDRREEVDDIWRELIQFFLEEPEIDVQFEGLGEYESFPLKIVDTDNTSDITAFSDRGRLYRQTINMEVPQAKLLFLEGKNLVKSIPIRMVDLGNSEFIDYTLTSEEAP